MRINPKASGSNRFTIDHFRERACTYTYTYSFVVRNIEASCPSPAPSHQERRDGVAKWLTFFTRRTRPDCVCRPDFLLKNADSILAVIWLRIGFTRMGKQARNLSAAIKIENSSNLKMESRSFIRQNCALMRGCIWKMSSFTNFVYLFYLSIFFSLLNSLAWPILLVTGSITRSAKRN